MAVNDLAGGGDLGSQSVEQLFAGELPVFTESRTVKSGETAMTEYTVVAVEVATGLVVRWDPTVTDGSEIIYGVLAQAVDSSAGAKDGQFYIGGSFNHAMLGWPAAIDTLAERRAAFLPKPTININKLK